MLSQSDVWIFLNLPFKIPRLFFLFLFKRQVYWYKFDMQYIALYLTYIFKECILLNVDIHPHIRKHQHNLDNEQIYDLKSFPWSLGDSFLLSLFIFRSRQSLSYFLSISLQFQEFYINGIMKLLLCNFSMASFTHHNYSDIHSCYWQQLVQN